ncbi:MAG: hypothetical protein RL291_1409, partial [Pseudomonadota bacterium]
MRRNHRGSRVLLALAVAGTGGHALTVALAQQPAPAATAAPAADPKLIAYGKHLARECTACHRIDGTDNGIPSIVGGDREEFETNMGFYKNGERNNPAMVSVAQSLDTEQI